VSLCALVSPSEQLAHDLAKWFPQLKPVVVNHVYCNFGELLPRRFLGEVLWYTLATHDTRDPSEARQLVQPILDFIERRFQSGDDEVRELIVASFVQPLAHQGEAGHRLRLMLGPALQAAAEGTDSRG